MKVKFELIIEVFIAKSLQIKKRVDGMLGVIPVEKYERRWAHGMDHLPATESANRGRNW
jgi:hypothetical protein